MNKVTLICCAIILCAISGCRSVSVCSVSMNYVNNWSTLRAGMTQEEVLGAVGWPAIQSNTGKPNQRWFYRALQRDGIIYSGVESEYVIWFDKTGRVEGFRGPITVNPRDKTNSEHASAP